MPSTILDILATEQKSLNVRKSINADSTRIDIHNNQELLELTVDGEKYSIFLYLYSSFTSLYYVFIFDLQRFYIGNEADKLMEIKTAISARKRLERNLTQNILRPPPF